MLAHRLLVGSVMFVATAAVFYLDACLDGVSIEGTFLQTLFRGRAGLPPGLLMSLVFAVLIVLSAGELCVIFRAKGIRAGRFIVTVAALTGFASMCSYQFHAPPAPATLATALVLLFLVALVDHSCLHRRIDGAVAAGAATLMASVYLGLLPGFYAVIRSSHSAWVVAGIIVVTKFGDTGAYFTGRSIGRHKLIPWLSPGKTWEGLAGAVVTAVAVALLLALFGNSAGLGSAADRPWPYGLVALGGAVLGLVGHVGDLTASLLKRDAGFKDSGGSILGFGGMLDVFDSPIVAAPAAYWMLELARGPV